MEYRQTDNQVMNYLIEDPKKIIPLNLCMCNLYGLAVLSFSR